MTARGMSTLALSKFPPVTGIHAKPCKHCPSTKDLSDDLEAQDEIAAPHDYHFGAIFRCAWRPEKLCRGQCDLLKITKDEEAIVLMRHRGCGDGS